MFSRTLRLFDFALPALALAALAIPSASAQSFDPDPLWPLCGNITVAPPPGWLPEHGCPLQRAGDPAYADGPISDTFGPRLAGNGLDFDWHRGLDLPVPEGTPVFAVAAGEVVTSNDLPPIDKTVMIKHPRPGNDPDDSCEPNGCYFSRYRHLSAIAAGAVEGAWVDKGTLLGETGHPEDSSFEHLHFEIRSAIDDEPDGSQREAIHPLAVLPRGESGSNGVDATLAVAFDHWPTFTFVPAVDVSDPEHPVVTVSVTLPDATQELDVDSVQVTVYENRGDSLVLVPQPNDYAGTHLTPEGEVWHVHPPSLSIGTWNRQFTYKDGYGIDFYDFQTGQVYESPWHLDLPSSWGGDATADFHLTHRKYDDTGVSGDRRLLAFNGIEVYAPKFNASKSWNQYKLYVKFLELDGVADADDLCLEAVAFDVAGNRSPVAQWGHCTITP